MKHIFLALALVVSALDLTGHIDPPVVVSIGILVTVALILVHSAIGYGNDSKDQS